MSITESGKSPRLSILFRQVTSGHRKVAQGRSALKQGTRVHDRGPLHIYHFLPPCVFGISWYLRLQLAAPASSSPPLLRRLLPLAGRLSLFLRGVHGDLPGAGPAAGEVPYEVPGPAPAEPRVRGAEGPVQPGAAVALAAHLLGGRGRLREPPHGGLPRELTAHLLEERRGLVVEGPVHGGDELGLALVLEAVGEHGEEVVGRVLGAHHPLSHGKRLGHRRAQHLGDRRVDENAIPPELRVVGVALHGDVELGTLCPRRD
mmetsp:Transcript_61461/g.139137  ORF Transcript_61461/g.139137 Transcript_61461/m.139137 type:complete len:260 (+) Transcript_61461:100-879(+)